MPRNRFRIESSRLHPLSRSEQKISEIIQRSNMRGFKTEQLDISLPGFQATAHLSQDIAPEKKKGN